MIPRHAVCVVQPLSNYFSLLFPIVIVIVVLHCVANKLSHVTIVSPVVSVIFKYTYGKNWKLNHLCLSCTLYKFCNNSGCYFHHRHHYQYHHQHDSKVFVIVIVKIRTDLHHHRIIITAVLQVPELSNQVLLSELLLDDNSIMSLSSLQNCWLPSVTNLSVAHNRFALSQHALLFGIVLRVFH